MSLISYPTDEEIERIKTWPHDDLLNLMNFVSLVWSDMGTMTRKGRTFRCVTGGWSGNQEILAALQENVMFWTLCWESSNRGGRHIFRVPKIEPGPNGKGGKK